MPGARPAKCKGACSGMRSLNWQNLVSTLALLLTFAVAGWRLVQSQIDAVQSEMALTRSYLAERIYNLETDTVKRKEFEQFEKRLVDGKGK
jgi:hypothetical protein